MPDDLQLAPEVAWAGDYSTAFTPTRAGPHQVRVLLPVGLGMHLAHVTGR